MQTYSLYQVWYKYVGMSFNGFAIKYGFNSARLHGWVTYSHVPRDVDDRVRLKEALSKESGVDCTDMDWWNEKVDMGPENGFATLHDLFDHLGVSVRIDESAFYKYTLESHE